MRSEIINTKKIEYGCDVGMNVPSPVTQSILILQYISKLNVNVV